MVRMESLLRSIYIHLTAVWCLAAGSLTDVGVPTAGVRTAVEDWRPAQALKNGAAKSPDCMYTHMVSRFARLHTYILYTHRVLLRAHISDPTVNLA